MGPYGSGWAGQGRAGQNRAGQKQDKQWSGPTLLLHWCCDTAISLELAALVASHKQQRNHAPRVTQSSAICPSNDNLHASKTPGRLTQSALSLPQSQAYAVKSQEVISTGLGCVRSANIKKYIKRCTTLLGDTLSTDP